MPERPAKILSPSDAQAVLQRNVANIVKKAAAGKPLTPKELALIQNFTDTEHAPRSTPPEWCSSYETLGKLLGLHRASFPRLKRDHADCPKPRANGDHNVAAWRGFIEAHGIVCKSEHATRNTQHASLSVQVNTAPAADPPSKFAFEIEKLRQQCRRIAFENDVREGKYILAADAARWTTEMIAEFVKVLDGIPSTLAPDIVGIGTVAEAELRIRASLEQAKAMLQSRFLQKETKETKN